jgi:2-oxoglutarate dehydrogenase complex dehydrogenase (E1) component-like enzyme
MIFPYYVWNRFIPSGKTDQGDITALSRKVELVWVQEEQLNMGAALFVKQQIGCTLRVISRPSSGVTAEGLTAQHKVHQAVIMDKALNLIQD